MRFDITTVGTIWVPNYPIDRYVRVERGSGVRLYDYDDDEIGHLEITAEIDLWSDRQ